MRMRALSPIVLALAAAALPAPALAGPWLLAPGEYYVELDAARSFTDTYLDDNGDRRTTPFVSERRALQTSVELGWKKHLSFRLAAPIVSVTNRAGTAQRTATGIGDLTLGFKYGLMTGASALALELDVTEPLGTLVYPLTVTGEDFRILGLGAAPGFPVYRAGPPIGVSDGLQEVALAVHYGAAVMRRGFAQVSIAGARRFLEGPLESQEDSLKDGLPNPDYSPVHQQDQVKVAVEAGAWARGALLLSGHYRGVVTVAHGDGSPDEAAHVVGPEIRYRVDDRLDVIAGSNHTAAGHRTHHVDEYYLGLAFRQTKLDRLQGFLGNLSRP